VETTKQQLAQVLQKSQEINQLMQSISEATVSQADTSQVVTTLMQQVTEAAEGRSQFSRQVAEAIQQTAQVAQQLETTVAQFKVQ
jgi:twitching motility protein PilJ